MGYVGCSTVEALTAIFANCSHTEPMVTEGCCAHILAMMSCTHSGLTASNFPSGLFGLEEMSVQDLPQMDTWNVEVFVRAVKDLSPGLDWSEVIRLLDNRYLSPSVDFDGLSLIFSTFAIASKENFPIDLFFGRWRNSAGQLGLMKAILSRADETSSLVLQSSRRVHDSEVIWGSVDFVEALLRLSDSEGCDEVGPLFAPALTECPDVLILSLAHSHPSWGPLYRDMVSSLLDRLVRLQLPDSLNLIQRVWACNRAILIQGLVEMYCRHCHHDTVKSILDIVGQLGPNALLEVLSTKQNYFFVCDLAVAAAKTQAIPFANWISRALSEGGDEFALSCVNFLRDRFYGGGHIQPSAVVSLSPEIAGTMLQSLQTCKTAVASGEIRKLVKDAQGRLLGGAPPMQNMPIVNAPGTVGLSSSVGNSAGSQVTETQEGGSQQAVQQQQGQTLFPPDIEEEANSHFQRIYTSEMQIEGVIQMLKGFKMSQNQREQEVFACMIHNLFDEYRFFPR